MTVLPIPHVECPALAAPGTPRAASAGRSATAAVSRRTGFAVACLLAVAYFLWTHAYWTPLHNGVDQNGYLVGGKMFSRTLEPGQTPTVFGDDKPDFHAFVANMWVADSKDPNPSNPAVPHTFYPKYPVGLPLLYALLIWAGAGGVTAAYALSPVASAATLPAVYLVVRRYGGTFAGLLAGLSLATSPLMAYLVNNPNSHAVALFCATWGMAAVLHWWHGGRLRWAAAGGLLVGYTATVRYSEGLLVLPLLWCCVVRSPERRTEDGPRPADAAAARGLGFRQRTRAFRRRVKEAAVLLAAWAVPVAALATYNWFVLGTLTGYDATNESTGFAWSYFFDNWETLVRDYGTLGLFFLLPLAVGGGVVLAWRDWRTAGVLWLWAVPSVTLYAFYYWGPDGWGYLRFFATTLPPLLAAALWPARAFGTPAPDRPAWRAVARPVVALLVGGATAMAVFFAVRYELSDKRLVPLGDYLNRPPTAYQRAGGRVSLLGGVVLAGAVAAAMTAARRRDAAALAVGLVTLVGVAASSDAATAALEQTGYETAVQAATAAGIRGVVPDGAVVVCREETVLQYLQFLTDDRCYTGLTFDRNWIAGRPRAATEDPVLYDPVRGRQLFDALGKFDQNALNEQARQTVRRALAAKRRVFVVDAPPPDQLLTAVRQKKDGPVPEFVTRYVNGKNTKLVAKRVAWWTVPQVVKDVWPGIPRGRKTARPNFRTTCYQVWEVTAG